MTQPGNAWHLPASEELARDLFMRSPLYPNDPRAQDSVRVFTGNQYDGGEGAGNQLQDPERTVVKHSLDGKKWTKAPLTFDRAMGNNKYFRADIPIKDLKVGTQVQYYFVLRYENKSDTVVGVAGDDPTGWTSAALMDEKEVRPFVFTVGTQNQQKAFGYVPGTPKEIGQWSELFPLPEVGVHASLLRTEEVLYWGRRDTADQSMNTVSVTPDRQKLASVAKPATCTPFLLNLKTLTTRPAKQPFMPDGGKLNALLPRNADGKVNADLFCSGHAFLPDGRLLVVGGHLADGIGLDQSCIYDPMTESWESVPTKGGIVMGNGRWYPTVTNLPTGRVIVASGGYKDGEQTPNNFDTQLFSYKDEVRTSEHASTMRLLNRNEFTSVDPTADRPLDLYPRMHVASSGIIYWVSTFNIWALNMAADEKKWKRIGTAPDKEETDRTRAIEPLRDYACSVMYDTDKVVYIGGGKTTAVVDHLDLSEQTIVRNTIKPMMFPRRQHNATVLPDGSILVTGGTRGDGRDAVGPSAGDVRFNDLRPGQPVHVAELWNASTREWKLMAAEQIDRCYHATAVLLPDGRVLSAGGGEFQLNDGRGGQLPNPPIDSHRDAQIFSPPYLFIDGPRPQIKSISTKVIECGSDFQITAADVDQIETISLIGLSSVTHSLNSGQRRMTLQFTQVKATLNVKAPLNARTCSPGFYMLFILNKKSFPSVAQIVQVMPRPEKQAQHRQFTAQMVAQDSSPPTAVELRQAVRQASNGTRIELGITPICPYGLSACWGGAYDALSSLTGVERVDPIPHASGSTASIYLADTSLPDLNLWSRQFKSIVNEIYGLRGFEADVSGRVEEVNDGIALILNGVTSRVALVPLDANGKIQWDSATRQPSPVTDEEVAAYYKLQKAVAKVQSKTVRIIGPLSQNEAGYQLQVRIAEL